MRIIIEEKKGKAIKIVLPTGMLLNRLTASMMPGMLEKKGIVLTKAQAIRIVQAVRSCRRHFPDWKMVEIDSANGEHIEIRL